MKWFVILLLVVLASGCVTNPPDDVTTTTGSISNLTTISTPTGTVASVTTLPSITLTTTSTTILSDKFEGRYIDVHAHIMPNRMPLAQIVRSMDKEGIDKMVIMQVPVNIYKIESQSEYGIPDAAMKYPNRFIALYEGEAITMLYNASVTGSYTKSQENTFVSLLEDAMKSGKYNGFGEIALRHFPPRDRGFEDDDITVPGDHPWMFILSDIAAKYDVPIDIHMEATDETIAGFEKLLYHNNKTKIIWDHASWSNTGKATPQLMEQLMEKHPNLYASIKIREPRTPELAAVKLLDDNGNIAPEWMSLLKNYPDRFMIGSDIKPGAREDEFRYIKEHKKVLEQLPHEILKKIERENAEIIFGLF